MSRKFSEITKKQKKNCKKTPPQGTKSGKSKHKNIEAVNSRIDGLFFVFIFVFAPPKGLTLFTNSAAFGAVTNSAAFGAGRGVAGGVPKGYTDD